MSLERSQATLGQARKSLIQPLLDWYTQNARKLPWRVSPDPYRVWISEIMSQQSTLAMMLPYYRRWMENFPELADLAQAPPETVLTLWEGLGYYSRARNVHAAAQLLQRRLEAHGAWPRTPAEWLDLPGVGPYTAAAVTAICFDEATLPLDGNVIRVLARLRGIEDPLNSGEDRRRVRAELDQIATAVPAGQRGAMAQALMELGALVCRPGANAACEACPLRAACALCRLDGGKTAGKHVERTPRAKLRTAMKHLTLAAPLYRGHSPGELLLRQIPAGQRLEEQWEIPTMDVSDLAGTFVDRLKKSFEVLGPVTHTITHHQYRIYGVLAGAWGPSEIPAGHRFFELDFLLGEGANSSPGERAKVTITTATRKLLHFVVDSAT